MRIPVGAVLLSLIICGPGYAACAPEPSELESAFNRAGVKPRRQVVIVTTAGDTLRGSFVRIADGPGVLVRRYLAPEDRFGLTEIPSGQIERVRLVDKHSSGTRALNGALIGGACGALLGVVATSGHSGDVGPSGDGVLGAAAGFLFGGATGLLIGAITSTTTAAESDVWPAR